MKEFKLSECGTHMIHRENGWTIKDCRTAQQQRWSKIRHAERMKIEKQEREETVARWRARKCMKREDHLAPDVLGATPSKCMKREGQSCAWTSSCPSGQVAAASGQVAAASGQV